MNKPEANEIAAAIENALISPNVMDSNFESANVVDVLAELARAVHKLSEAHYETPLLDMNNKLSEAIKDAGLNIAIALGDVATAIREAKQ